MGFASILSLSALLLVMLAVGTALAEQSQFSCGFEYFSTVGAWFKMHTESEPLVVALTTCMSEGAYITSPINSDVQWIMRELMLRHENISLIHTSMLLDDTKKNKEARDPARLTYALNTIGGLDTVTQGHHLPYICYKKASHGLPSNECDTTAPVFTALAERRQFPCGFEYYSTVGAWFKMHTESEPWVLAHTTCIHEGAYLTSPISNDVTKIMNELMLRHKNINLIHTSMHLDDTKTNRGALDPARPTYALNTIGGLDTVTQGHHLPYICYRKATNELTLNECGTTAPGYKLDNRTNRCYKFHRNRNTWTGAAQTCNAEGGDLAIINSEEEAKVIRKIFAQNPTDVIPGNSVHNLAFLGFLADHNGIWKTLRAQTLSEAGYEGWAPGRPKNTSRMFSSCGSVGRNGKLYDVKCGAWLPYICAIEMNHCD